ncbi:MAG: DUF1648 domain-containing protein [Nocardioides sp.]|nr:DUF1648 domain-containing protein [Nocardioides sp.]
MRAFFAFTCVVFFAAMVIALYQFPDEVPVHVDASGAPDRFQPRNVALGILLVIGVVLMAVFEILIRVVPAKGLHALNLPHRDFWLRAENQPRLRTRLTADLSFLSGCAMLLLSGVILVSAQVFDGVSPDLGVAGTLLLLVFAAVTLSYVVFMFTVRYKPRVLVR